MPMPQRRIRFPGEITHGRLTPGEIQRKASAFLRRLAVTGNDPDAEFRRWAARYWWTVEAEDVERIRLQVVAELRQMDA